MTILIAGAGIAGLTLGLTLHEIGADFRIFEAVGRLRPLGVGINLQPNAVRELFDLGLEASLDNIAVRTKDYGFYTKTGREIWTEPRGRAAGYAWPQYSVHRGKLQMALHDELMRRAGPGCIVTGARATGFRNRPSGVELLLVGPDGAESVTGEILVAADGINSALRAQMVTGEGAPVWNGAVMWRGTTRARPFLSGASMILAGHDSQRFVAYPISGADSDGMATINWIAELRVDPDEPRDKSDWNREADIADVLPQFAGWDFGWLDVPGLIGGADKVYEYPMVDRDPLPSWTEGRVTLIGDAAHATYPVGSNGASQAIVDARVLGAALLANGVAAGALAAYEARMRPAAEKILRANRSGQGPDAVMQLVEDKCGGVFENISDVVSQDELAAHAAKYKSVAGFSIEDLNALAPTIAPGSRLG